MTKWHCDCDGSVVAISVQQFTHNGRTRDEGMTAISVPVCRNTNDLQKGTAALLHNFVRAS